MMNQSSIDRGFFRSIFYRWGCSAVSCLLWFGVKMLIPVDVFSSDRGFFCSSFYRLQAAGAQLAVLQAELSVLFVVWRLIVQPALSATCCGCPVLVYPWLCIDPVAAAAPAPLLLPPPGRTRRRRRRWARSASHTNLDIFCCCCRRFECCLPCRAYKEEEKKMGTLQQENIERPDSMTTTGEPQQHSAIYYDEQLFAVAPYASNACKGCMRTCTSCRLCCGQLDL